MPDTREELEKLYESHLNSQSDKYTNEALTRPVEGSESIDSQYQSSARRVDPNEFAALNQTGLDKAGNIAGRGLNTFVGGVLGTVSLLHDIPASVFTSLTGDKSKGDNQGWDYFMNESWGANVAKLQDDINKEVPLYQTYKDSQTPFTLQNVADGFTQGLAFIGSAYVGGGITGKILNQAAKVSRLSSIGKLNLVNPNKLASLGIDNKVAGMLTNYIDKSKTLGGAVYNRAFESTLEAKGTGQELRGNLEAENEDYYNQTGTYKYTDDDIDNRVRQAEKLNFGFNLALGLVDAYQNVKLFKGFSTDITKAASNKIDDAIDAMISNKSILSKGIGYTAKVGRKAGALTSTGLAEAGEELAQYSSNKLAQDLATNNYTEDDWDNFPNLLKNIVGKMGEDIINDPNAQFSALIGGLVGAPMGLIANQAEAKREELTKAQKTIAQQSLIEKTTLAGLYKIKHAQDNKTKVEGEIQVRFANDKGFQQTVLDQLDADNFDGLITDLESKKETTSDELKTMGIQPRYNSITGQEIKPSETINEAIESAKKIRNIHQNVNLNFARQSADIRRNITSIIADSEYFDKKIDIVQSNIVNTINKYITNPNILPKILETNPDILSKPILDHLGEYVSTIEKSLEKGNLSFANINIQDKDLIEKHLEELSQLQKHKEETIDLYNKYKNQEFVDKQEAKIQKNTERLENPKEEESAITPQGANISSSETLSTESKPITPTKTKPVAVDDIDSLFGGLEDKVYEGKLSPQDYILEEPTDNVEDVGEDIPFDQNDLFSGITPNNITPKDLEATDIVDKPITETKEVKRLSTFTEESTDNNKFNYEQYTVIKDSKGNTYKEPNFEELQKVEKNDILTIKGLVASTVSKSDYGLLGIFNKEGEWLSTIRLTQGTNNPASNEAKKIYKEVFNTDNVVLGDNKPVKEFTFKSPYISLREINVGTDLLDLMSIQDDSTLSKKIIKQDDIPTILRVKSPKGVTTPVVVLGNKEIPTTDIYFGNLTSGDTYVLSEKSNTPEGNKYIALPLNVKTLGETTLGKELLTSIDQLKLDINSIKSTDKDAKTKRDEVFNKWLETRSYISSLIKIINSDKEATSKSDRIVDLKMDINNNKEVQISITTQYTENRKTVKKESTVDLLSKDVDSQLDKFKSILLDVKPSLSIEGFNNLSFLSQDQIYDQVKEFLQTKVNPDKPFKGTNITVPFLEELESSKVTKDPEIIIQNTVETIKPVNSGLEVKKADIERRRQAAIEGVRGITKVSKGKTSTQYTTTEIKDGGLFPNYSTEKEVIDAINSKYDSELTREIYKELKSGIGRTITQLTKEEQIIWNKYGTQELRDSVDIELAALEEVKTENKYSKRTFSNKVFDEVKLNTMLEGKSPKIVQEVDKFKREFLTKLKANNTKYSNMLPQMQVFLEEYINSDGKTELKKPC